VAAVVETRVVWPTAVGDAEEEKRGRPKSVTEQGEFLAAAEEEGGSPAAEEVGDVTSAAGAPGKAEACSLAAAVGVEAGEGSPAAEAGEDRM